MWPNHPSGGCRLKIKDFPHVRCTPRVPPPCSLHPCNREPCTDGALNAMFVVDIWLLWGVPASVPSVRGQSTTVRTCDACQAALNAGVYVQDGYTLLTLDPCTDGSQLVSRFVFVVSPFLPRAFTLPNVVCAPFLCVRGDLRPPSLTSLCLAHYQPFLPRGGQSCGLCGPRYGG